MELIFAQRKYCRMSFVLMRTYMNCLCKNFSNVFGRSTHFVEIWRSGTRAVVSFHVMITCHDNMLRKAVVDFSNLLQRKSSSELKNRLALACQCFDAEEVRD